MKKDGIQTRNRKLSSKSKKKKGGFAGFEGMMRPLDKSGFGFPSAAQFGAAGMSPYMAYQNQMPAMGTGFVSPQMGMGGMGLGMGNLAISSAAPSAMVSKPLSVSK